METVFEVRDRHVEAHVTLDEIRSAAAVVLDNSDDHYFDDNPNRTMCIGCGWDSRKDQPLPNEPMHGWHKPGCELAAARRLLQDFVTGAEVEGE